MDLDFLRKIAGGLLPRIVPPGPAFQAVVTYVDAGYLEADIPMKIQQRSGFASQPDLIVFGVTSAGWDAIGQSVVQHNDFDVDTD